MPAFNDVNIKELNQIEEIANGNFLIVENDNGTNILNFQNFVIGPDNASFYTEIQSISSNLAAVSAVAVNSQAISTRQLRSNSINNSNSVYEFAMALNGTGWLTLKTLTPSATTGVFLRGLIDLTVAGNSNAIGNGVVENGWFFDINNTTFTSGYIGTGTASLCSGSLPQIRVNVSGSNFIIQAQSSNSGSATFNGMAYLKLFLPSGTGTGVTWTVS
jgi:hypothetical protein